MRSVIFIILWFFLSGWLVSSAEVVSRLAGRQPSLSNQLVKIINTISANALESKELAGLLQVSNVQEIIWRLREVGDVEAADRLYQAISDQLEQARVVAIKDIARGSSKPQLVELEGGLRAIFKSDEMSVDVEREVLLHKLDYAIGTNVVPITITRTIKGRTGSLQLFVENSSAADEIAMHRLKALGFDNTQAGLGIHSLSAALTPERSPAAKTLQLLTIEGDSNNSGNYLLPKIGRQIAIDGSYAFDVQEFIAEVHIKELQGNMSGFLLDKQIAANFEAILNADSAHPVLQAIRKLDIDESEFYDDILDYHSVEANMRLVLAAYSDAVGRVRTFDSLTASEEQENLLELLSLQRWEEANDLLARDTELRVSFGGFAPALQELAMRKRDHELLQFLHTNAPSGSLNLSQYDIVNYAVHAEDISFATSLKALGFEVDAPDTATAWRTSIHHAVNFGELKLATRLMDKLMTQNDSSNSEFMLALLQLDSFTSDKRRLKWLTKYEDFFSRELKNEDRLVDILAHKIRLYTTARASVSHNLKDPELNMIAFLVRVCGCQQLGDRIAKSFKQLDSELMLVTEKTLKQRLNTVAAVLQENGMPSTEVSKLAAEIKTVAYSYSSIDDLNSVLKKVLSKVR